MDRLRDWLRANGPFLLGMATVLLIVLFMVRAVLHSSYSGDDVQNSQIPMRIKAAHSSFWIWLRTEISYWRKAHGRFFPMSTFETMVIFGTFKTRAAYKLFQVFTVLAAVGMFMVTLSVLTKRRSLGILAGALVALDLQIRIFHDPILQFSAQQPIVICLLLGTLLCFHQSLARKNPWLLIPTVLLWVAALLTYETMYFLSPLFVFALLLSDAKWRDRLRALVVVAVPAMVLVAYIAHIRGDAQIHAPQYTSNLDPSAVMHTMWFQAGAAVPMNYAHYHPHPAILPMSKAWAWAPIDPILFALTAAVIIVSVLRLRGVHWRVPAFLGLAGALIWTVPAAIVSATKQWQDALAPGIGYVSVFVEYFGVAMLLVGGLAAVIALLRGHSRPRYTVLPLAIILGLLGAFTVQVTADNNVRAVSAFDGLRYPRETLERGVERGLFERIPRSTVIDALKQAAWFNPWFVEWYGGPPLQIPGPPLDLTPCGSPTGYCEKHTPEMVFVHRADEDTGIAVLGDFRAATVSGPGAVDAFSSTLTVYIEHRGLNRANAGGIVQAASAWAPAPAPSAKVGAHPFEPGEVTVRSAGEGWALLDVHPRRGVISVQSLTGDFLNVLLPLRDAAYSGHTLHGAP